MADRNLVYKSLKFTQTGTAAVAIKLFTVNPDDFFNVECFLESNKINVKLKIDNNGNCSIENFSTNVVTTWNSNGYIGKSTDTINEETKEHYYYYLGSANFSNESIVSIRYNINYGNITIDNELITTTDYSQIATDIDILLTQSGKDYIHNYKGNTYFVDNVKIGKTVYPNAINVKNILTVTDDGLLTSSRRNAVNIDMNSVKDSQYDDVKIDGTTYTNGLRTSYGVVQNGFESQLSTVLYKQTYIYSKDGLNSFQMFKPNKSLVFNFSVDSGIFSVPITINDSNTLTVSGLSYLNGGINVNSRNFTVDTDGNIKTKGKLGVTGASTLENTLTVYEWSYLNGGIDVNNGKFKVDKTTGNTTINGTLDVSGRSLFTNNIFIGANESNYKVKITKDTGEIKTNGSVISNGLYVNNNGNENVFSVDSNGNTSLGDTSLKSGKTLTIEAGQYNFTDTYNGKPYNTKGKSLTEFILNVIKGELQFEGQFHPGTGEETNNVTNLELTTINR